MDSESLMLSHSLRTLSDMEFKLNFAIESVSKVCQLNETIGSGH